MKIKFYYGLSGCLKGTTIQATEKDSLVMPSSIKNWKHYQDGLFNGMMQYDDLVYSILHFVRFEEFIKGGYGKDLVVERGITDSLFYRVYNDEYVRHKENPDLILESVQTETSLIPFGYEIEKVLLIQRDIDFVANTVLKDPYRNKTFKGDPELYMDLQNKYIEWTMAYNQINRAIEINDAKTYIEEVLGIKYFNPIKSV